MSKDSPNSLRVYQAIARALSENGVETLFGLIGEANLFMVDSFVRDAGGKFIAASNEAGAASMALGYSLIAGKPGVCSVTAGPAVTNTITALVEGVKGSIPMVLLCGETGAEDLEHTQKIDHRPFIIGTGAGYERLRSPNTVSVDIARALRRAWIERRPIALSLPIDFDWCETKYEFARNRLIENKAFVAESDELDNAIGIIAAARRPIILVGRGAISPDSKEAILKLSRRIDAPIATTLKAKDLFRGESHNLGVFGTLSTPATVDIIMESDCLIALGASLNYRTTSRGTFLKGKRVIQINSELSEIGKNGPADAGLVGDPAKITDLLIHWLNEAEIPPSGFCNGELKTRIANAMPQPSLAQPQATGTIDYLQALMRLERALPENRVLVTDTGRIMPGACVNIRATDPQSYITTTNFGSIGFAFTHAVGAACASNGRPVVVINGDGAFMHGGLAEFNTAVRHHLDLIVIVANDGAYGSEENIFRQKLVDPASSFFDWPEFAPLAIALGGHGVTVRSEMDLDHVEDAIRNRSKPLLIDIKLDPSRMAAGH
jgi:thiamine pyrophosphate-dependent acetolactate synthase large subunit-like protein